MSKFIESLCIMSAAFKINDINKKYIDFTVKTMINNQERMMKFRLTLACDRKGETFPFNVTTLGEKFLIAVSDEEADFRMNMSRYRDELFERLKEENGVRFPLLFQ